MKTLRQFRDRRCENEKLLKHPVAEKALKLRVESLYSANTVFKKECDKHSELAL